MTVEFRVWNEAADLLGEYDNKADADACRDREAASCPCGTDGQEETPGRGNFRCGTLHPHGIHLQIIEDGQDVTASDFGQWG